MDMLKFPENALDVLAQYLIGLTIVKEWDIDDGYELVKSSWPYRNLPYDDYIEVLDLRGGAQDMDRLGGEHHREEGLRPDDLLHEHWNHRSRQ